MKIGRDNLFNSDNVHFPNVESRLREIIQQKKGQYVSIEHLVVDVWQLILNGLPYVVPDRTGEYLLSQAKDFRTIIGRSESICDWANIKRLLEFDVSLKDRSLEAANGCIRPHNINVARYTRAVCQAMGYKKETIDQIAFSGELHDIGKIGVPDHILNKPDKLTPEEFELVKPHPVIGASVLSLLSDLFKLPLEHTIEEVELHHERYHGGGYPYGKTGDDIPLGAQIISICDVFDALTSKRPYRDPFTVKNTLLEMQRNHGGHFDEDLLDYAIRPLAQAAMEILNN